MRDGSGRPGWRRGVAVIRAAQTVGVSLREIRSALDGLPSGRTPNKAEWARLSLGWRDQLEERIETLERLRQSLTGCIGCGCLSLRTCKLFNREDQLASRIDASLLMGRAVSATRLSNHEGTGGRAGNR